MAPVDGEIFFQDACQILSSAEKTSIFENCEVVLENVHFSDVHIGPLKAGDQLSCYHFRACLNPVSQWVYNLFTLMKVSRF